MKLSYHRLKPRGVANPQSLLRFQTFLKLYSRTLR
jgi:hypothetical protein